MKKQFFNKKINAWVIGTEKTNEKGGKYVVFSNVKQKEPQVPFKNIRRG